MSSWKSVLQKQQDDLERLEAMDRDLTNDQGQMSAEADRVLKRNNTFGVSFTHGDANSIQRTERLEIPTPSLNLDLDLDLEEGNEMSSSPNRSSTSARGVRPSSAGRSSTVRRSKDDSITGSNGPPTPTPTAADTAARFAKAKMVNLQKQLTDSEDLRRKLQEQNSDLQRTLKNEREESKKASKRIALLEADARRESRKPSNTTSGSNNVESLTQEVSALKKDISTAQRLTKTAETTSKNKDIQVRRAQEAVARMKVQIEELQSRDATVVGDDRARADAAESRVKVLERQRADLVSAFKKQMKLIDVLKRQKMHVEAARLLSFTEEEFVKTLDWSL
jgi:hypothetical protein